MILRTNVMVNKIIYKKADWGILSLLDIDNNNVITAKGIFDDGIKENNKYTFIGEEVIDAKYGKQYNIQVISEMFDLNDGGQLNDFLSNILTPIQTKSFIETFDNPVEVIKRGNIKEICKVKGIGEVYANLIVKKYNENKKYLEIFSVISGYGITFNLVKKIIDKYKTSNKVLNIIQHNPYKLIADIKGIGWNVADDIAKKVGIKEDSIERLGGFVLWKLDEGEQQGHSWTTFSRLLEQSLTLFPSRVISGEEKIEIRDKLVHAIKTLQQDKILYISENGKKIGLQYLYNLEEKIGEELMRIYKGNSTSTLNNFDSRLAIIEKEQGFEFNEKQRHAIKLALTNNILILTGFAGCGKTSTVNGIIKLIGEDTFKMTALSGQAGARLKELTGNDGYTIHRLLEYNSKLKGFVRNKDNQLQHNIILDEASMVGGELFLSLLEACDSNNKLIIVGDEGQLESIGKINVFNDIISSNIFPYLQLTEIHRQAKKSAIVTQSFKVRNKEQLFDSEYVGVGILGEDRDFLLDVYSDSKMTNSHTVAYYKKFYEQVKDIKKIQVIVPMRDRGANSALSISKAIQSYLHKDDKNVNKINVCNGSVTYDICVGDRVVNRQNNYQTETTVFNSFEGMYETTEVFNGFKGVVKEINKGYMIIDFDLSGECIIRSDWYANIQLAYASTCHTNQGSQTDIVICGIDYSSYSLLSNEMVYTMITRAAKKCVLCCQNKALTAAINHSGTQTKQTFLVDILKNMNKEYMKQ